MNTENQNTVIPANRLAAIRALAVVGFVALIFIGMTLAVYVARFVPAAVSGIGEAAVSLSSVFVPADKPQLQVVNTGTEIPFGNPSVIATSTATTTVDAATTTTTVTTTAPVTPTAGSESTSATPIPGTGGGSSATITTNPASLYGLSDLTVTSITPGYLPSNSTSQADFVPSATVPANTSFAVKFTVTNVGTNATGQWDFSATLPTKQSYTFYSPEQQTLNPGDHLDLMLHLDVGEALSGSQSMTITLDPNRNLSESNENNNVTTANTFIN